MENFKQDVYQNRVLVVIRVASDRRYLLQEVSPCLTVLYVADHLVFN